ncbi:bZIP transcription factor 17-like [Impatiens glandulifera]|uniref:bZIP transcription factor 17-like n=1 Tax=Impatiens glandulifera TaxID=253017 RepID=UPI001FB0FE26|nr:bZIP transcription factor 17-like [Impatiens glandulifera]
MADQNFADLIPPYDGSLSAPPLDSIIFDDFPMDGNYIYNLDGADADIEDLDFIFDDLDLPSDTEDFFNSLPAPVDPIPLDPFAIAMDLANSYEFDQNSGADGISTVATVVSCEASDVSKFLNVSSPESSRQSGNKNPGGATANRVLEYPSSGSETHKEEVSEKPASSQGSGNCGSNVSEGLNCSYSDSANCDRSAASSPNPVNEPINGVVDPKVKFEEEGTNCLLKRKKGTEENFESRMNKLRKSRGIESTTDSPKASTAAITDDDDKKKARLMRNRESAQLSRQRKKHYVEELEDKMKNMHSTIQDLTAKISYIVAENASLRHQLNGGAMCPPPVAPPGMYPHPSMAPMGYPWGPYPPYVVKPQGSQVPLVPIPRLKSQQPASAPRTKKSDNKKASDVKKTETKTKKVASVSFLGLLFFIILFGGFAPIVNLKFGEIKGSVYNYGESYYPGNKFYDHNGRVLAVGSHDNGSQSDMVGGHDFIGKLNCKKAASAGHCVGRSKNETKEEESKPSSKSSDFGLPSNSSDTLSAYLYVPRNDKLVKIDGNLIIHSIMASEKAMAHSSRDDGKIVGEETGLAVASPHTHTHTGRSVGVNPHYYMSAPERKMALGSGPGEKGELKDGRLQQWFKEGLSGPLLSPGMCHEVFQFDVTPSSGAMVPATSVVKTPADKGQNLTQFAKGRNRRILESVTIPLPASNINITKKPMGIDPESLHSNKSNSPMVVSVLVDPREAGDIDGEGVMGPKALSRVFVVVLVDSVKYVTYSCGLPFKGSSSSRVTT